MKYAALVALLLTAACSSAPVGNPHVPEPAKSVELGRYLGTWYEIGRYDHSFERGCEAVTAQYTLREDGLIGVLNSCHQGGVDGPVKSADGRAKTVEGSAGAKLKVSFFGPFFVGDYWVLDHAADYSWSIVGEPSGKYLWLLTREARPGKKRIAMLKQRAREMGYDISMLYDVKH